MKIHALFLGLLLGLSVTGAFAQWQWLDKDGRKVFSDRAPPPDVLDKDVLRRPGAVPKKEAAAEAAAQDASPAPAPLANPAAGARKAQEAGVDKDLAAKKQQAADAEAVKRKAEEDKRAKNQAENCARAKQNQAELASGTRISRLNPSGVREYLDEAARAEEMRRVQAVMQSECK